MVKIREYIYSLLLLMVITLGGGGLFAQYIYTCNGSHCGAHNIRVDCRDEFVEHHHHHCSVEAVECEGHTAKVDSRCLAESNLLFEYVVKADVRRHLLGGGVSLLFCSMRDESCCLYSCDLQGLVDRWRQYDLYRGFDPSVALLRAPPVLI